MQVTQAVSRRQVGKELAVWLTTESLVGKQRRLLIAFYLFLLKLGYQYYSYVSS